MKSVTCLAIIAGELFAGVTMLAAYQAWIQPGAPRFQTQAKVAEIPVASAVVVAQAPPIPSPVPDATEVPQPQQAVVVPKRPVAVFAQPKPKVSASLPAPMQQSPAPRPNVQRHQAMAAPPAPVPIASPIPHLLAPSNYPATAMQRGIAALNSRDFPAAVTLLRQARQMQPANADLGYLMGMALEGTGEFGAAIDAFRSCQSGPYRQIAHSHVKALVKKLGRQ